MGKTFRHNPNHVESHIQTPDELEHLDWKHNNPTKTNPKELSNKNRHGHFTKQHTWPVRSEKGPNQKKQGHRKI